jgi:uncharacterized protein YbjT (DUF2867 family)
MRIFLTSGNGYIGSAVAEPLRAAGHQLTALARSDSSAAELEAARLALYVATVIRKGR